jgi:hypothetical protein
VNQAPTPKPKLQANPHLLFWRRLIGHAVADAKLTFAGISTDAAILARWWIEEHKPKQSDREEWERSFECACGWLDLDAAAERKRLLVEIDEHLRAAYEAHVRATVYLRRAAVLTCAGFVTAIGKQIVLPLASEADFDHVAGVEHGDPERVVRQMAAMAAPGMLAGVFGGEFDGVRRAAA